MATIKRLNQYMKALVYLFYQPLQPKRLFFLGLMLVSKLSYASSCELNEMESIDSLFHQSDHVFIAEVTSRKSINTESFLKSALKGLQSLMSIPSVNEEILNISDIRDYKGQLSKNEVVVIYCNLDKMHLKQPTLFFTRQGNDKIFVSRFYLLNNEEMEIKTSNTQLMKRLDQLSENISSVQQQKPIFCFGLYTCFGLYKFWPFI